MRYAIKGLGLSAALAAALLAGAATTATAAPAESGRGTAGVAERTEGAEGLYAPSALVLTVGKGEDPATATVERAVVLRCSPAPGGDHPAPERACAELRAVDGEFASLVETDGDRFCPMVWDPVTVTADGVWDGRRVSYSHTFANSCVMADATDRVFAF
ncbi:protease inhibitor protein [Streptomyces sp. TRM43335]|uniref:Probable subtilase-type protease inhibitor n=1 Tax=Streptomyces taklimakanensis TaxID=2569853 RepID=A0A6G2BB86_9ACTN|nr:subtilase-type protease inhibitor [Streptomyces taklimakanensis]MTE19484.1 protease inhibitor protein [Streptomyces taklimakanensis]